MKITFTPTVKYDGKFPSPEVSISYPSDDITLDGMLENLIIPALYGLGYKGVDNFFNPEEKENDEDIEEEIREQEKGDVKTEKYDAKHEEEFWKDTEKYERGKGESGLEASERNDKKTEVNMGEYKKKMDDLICSKKFQRMFISEQLSALLEEANKYKITK